MRNLFPGYYRPTQEEFDGMWQEGIFAFDANILLNIYRFTTAAQRRFIEILEELKRRSQIWLPHQSAYEYHKNRLNVISEQLYIYEQTNEKINELTKVVNYLSNQSQHPFVDFQDLARIINRAINRSQAILNKSRLDYPDLISSDPFLEIITRLFEHNTGDKYTEDELIQKRKEADERFKNHIPPGYSDAEEKNKRGEDQFGDAIIWFQLIDHMSRKHQPLIFVTDDKKGDWWRIHEDKKKNRITIGPRPELVEEMANRANIRFYMYQSDRFMEYAERYLRFAPEPEIIEEVRELRQRDEEEQYYPGNIAEPDVLAEMASLGRRFTALGTEDRGTLAQFGTSVLGTADRAALTQFGAAALGAAGRAAFQFGASALGTADRAALPQFGTSALGTADRAALPQSAQGIEIEQRILAKYAQLLEENIQSLRQEQFKIDRERTFVQRAEHEIQKEIRRQLEADREQVRSASTRQTLESQEE